MTTPVTVRLPNDLAQFLADRAESLHENKTSIVVAALLAEKKRCEMERERAIIIASKGTPYPDLPPMSMEQVAEVWKDLDW